MSVAVAGFKSSPLFEQIANVLSTNASTKDQVMKKAGAIFQFDVKNSGGTIQQWTLDLKKSGSLTKGPSADKPNITINVGDDDFVSLATGKLNGQKAFMSGKLKVKGNMMLATKLDGLLKDLGAAKAKL